MKKLDETFVSNEVERFRVLLKQCTNDERLEIINSITDGYCKHCGCDDPDCQCCNEE